MTDPETAPALRDDDAYADSIIDFVTASPTSYHATAEVARRLDAVGLTAVDEREPWGTDLPRRGYTRRDGAIIAWLLPERLDAAAGLRIVGAHTDSPGLRLKPHAAMVRDGVQVLNVEVYGGPLLNSFLDRELGLAGRLTTFDGTTHLVRTGPIARVAQVAPHLDRSVNESLHLDKQAHLLPLWTLTSGKTSDAAVAADTAPAGAATDAAGAGNDAASALPGPDAPEHYLCELAGIDPADLAFCDILTYPTEAPARFGRNGEFLASSRLDNLSSVHAALVALEALAHEGADAGIAGPIVFIANDHEEVGSGTRTGAAGPFLQTVLSRLAGAMGVTGDAYAALLARSVCVSADAGHAAHPNYPQLHDPAVRPVLGGGPLLKINAQQRYATDATAVAAWARACRAAHVPSQDFVSNNAVPCGTTIGPLTATRLGIPTVDVGQGLLSMHSQREMCAVSDGVRLARAMHAYWQGA
ncbi:M18 family aminopeptidase [Actinomyces succiniciruminis]|uniref:M18 family aminopeptidase n=1 Tax=Actinomyces succiniciruminis TaxID=1522002 RepID=A0A1L7RR07_9ACTO|nr:M18 family aminopeptidase [Actinomyces succiniciruminis]CED92724.1 M18 aminopeptidase [Actinomyces succiniciruminis]